MHRAATPETPVETTHPCPPEVRDAIASARAALEHAVRGGADLAHASEAAQIMGALTESPELAQALLARAVLADGLSAERVAAIVGPAATATAQALQRLGQLALPRDWSP